MYVYFNVMCNHWFRINTTMYISTEHTFIHWYRATVRCVSMIIQSSLKTAWKLLCVYEKKTYSLVKSISGILYCNKQAYTGTVRKCIFHYTSVKVVDVCTQTFISMYILIAEDLWIWLFCKILKFRRKNSAMQMCFLVFVCFGVVGFFCFVFFGGN